MANRETNCDIVVLLPVFNDAAGFSAIIREIDAALASSEPNVVVVVVDDGSFEPLTLDSNGYSSKCIREVRCVRLRGNIGHQRAIAVGLSYVHQNISCDAVLVMDADGEDKPSDAARLVERYRETNGSSIIFAERTKRSEGLTFLVFYSMYKLFAKVLTGHSVRVGNFSIIPRRQLGRLMISPDLWVHYAAAVFNARVPRDCIPTKRGIRENGHSSMNFVALVTHGLSAISVFGATVGVRLAVACTLASIVGGLSWMGYLVLWMSRSEATVDTLLLGTGVTVLFVLQTLLASFAFVFFILDNRTKNSFVPLRDYAYFVDAVLQLDPSRETAETTPRFKFTAA